MLARKAQCQRNFRVWGACGYGREPFDSAWMPALDRLAMRHGCFYEDKPYATRNTRSMSTVQYRSCWFPDVYVQVRITVVAYLKAAALAPTERLELPPWCATGRLSPQKKKLRAWLVNAGTELLVEEEEGACALRALL